jgi:hypothetical protein
MKAMNRCISGKRAFQSYENAVEALIAARTKFNYRDGNGPISVYLCEDCGFYHLTSQGPMNESLKKCLADGSIDRQKQAEHWEQRLKRK